MSKLQDMLRVQARLHRKQGANALGDLFDNSSKEIESLSEQLAKANESALFYKEQYEKTDRECTKLAMRESKANEREKRLEKILQRYESEQLQPLKLRVKELEQINLELSANVEACCELTEMDMGSAIERLFEIDNAESKTLLNKFAIENQIDSLEYALKSYVTAKFYPTTYAIQAFNDGVNHLHAHICERIEHLRKEQSNG